MTDHPPSGLPQPQTVAEVRIAWQEVSSRGPCAVCGVPAAKHGSYPTCATHAYTEHRSAAPLPVAPKAEPETDGMSPSVCRAMARFYATRADVLEGRPVAPKAEPECVTCQRCGFENWIQDGEAPGKTTARMRKLAAGTPAAAEPGKDGVA